MKHIDIDYESTELKNCVLYLLIKFPVTVCVCLCVCMQICLHMYDSVQEMQSYVLCIP